MSNSRDNNNNNMNDNNNSNSNSNNTPKRLSAINAIKSIISINNTYKRKSNHGTLININDNNRNINQLQAKKIKHNNNINMLNNVLIPVILTNCLSYLQLKELNLIINRVNKYWKSHTYNNITLGYREVMLDEAEYKLLSRYFHNRNNTRNNNNQAINLLNQIKYSSHIWFDALTSAELFLNIIKQAKCVQRLTIEFINGLNYWTINDESLNNIRLDKLQSLHIYDYFSNVDRTASGPTCDYLLRTLMKCVDLDKITDIYLYRIPVHSKPLQIFETNPFINLTNLKLIVRTHYYSNESLDYLCNLIQLTCLDLTFAGEIEPLLENWSWLIKLINLEEVKLSNDNVALSLLDEANCVKALTTLPKLRKLQVFPDIMNRNECTQLLAHIKLLTSLSIYGFPNRWYDFNRIKLTFPTIPTLKHLTIEWCNNTACIVRILKSNPQINSVKFQSCRLYSDGMVNILKVASSSLQYTFKSVGDYIMECSASYPEPLVHFSRFDKTLIHSTQFFTRLKQHLKRSYKCPNPNCKIRKPNNILLD